MYAIAPISMGHRADWSFILSSEAKVGRQFVVAENSSQQSLGLLIGETIYAAHINEATCLQSIVSLKQTLQLRNRAQGSFFIFR